MLWRAFAEKDDQGKEGGRRNTKKRSYHQPMEKTFTTMPFSAPQRNCPERLRLEGQQSILTAVP